MTALEALVTAMKDKLDKIAEVILGDPTDLDKPGVMVRLDRLERSDWWKNRVMFLIATGMIAALVKILT